MGCCRSKDTIATTHSISFDNAFSQNIKSNPEPSAIEQPSQLQSVARLPSTHWQTQEETSLIIDCPKPLRNNVENFVVVWLDALIDDQNEDIKKSKSELQRIVNDIRTYSNVNSAVYWMKTVQNEKIILIISGSFGEKVVPVIQNLTQIHIVYVFCSNKEKHKEWSAKYRKVKGVFTDILPLCEVLKKNMRKSEHDSIGFDVVGKNAVSTSANNNTQEASFMYAQLFKEFLLETDDPSKEELVEFCRQQYVENPYELEIIFEFDRDYHQSQVIMWYTRETFLYKMVNKALRTQDHLTLYALRLFIRDLHRQLAHLQADSEPRSNKLVLFRGQGLTKSDFEKLNSNNSGLLSMNTFLSTSENKEIALGFARESLGDPDTEAVLLQIDLNPMETSSAPYANIDDFSVYKGIEKEYLFSMGTVFRIGSTKKIEDGVWCVQLTFTKENDKQLEELTKHMRLLLKGLDICDKFGRLMNEMGLYKKAEHFYKLISTEKADWRQHAYGLNELGTIHARSGRLDEALECIQEALKIACEHAPEDDPTLADYYGNIGYLYKKKKELDLALQYHQRALKIDLMRPTPNQEIIAIRYSNMGTVLDDQNKLDEALMYYERALAIRLEHLPSTHPEIAASYNNIGYLYKKQGKKEKALDMYEKSLTVKLASLPPNHPMVALSHSNIAVLLRDFGRYDEALQHGLKALHISISAFGVEHSETQLYQNFVDELRQQMDFV
ncbi:unnamed protein product [Sphagnum troendelagicum]|uniref:NAD(P)(+)--arginine ADP-ribosyltransferase n=1 Tax=Sphagnum troendelagicum TaxID=128251 RepID=A0ABP0T6T3_9BRYO